MKTYILVCSCFNQEKKAMDAFSVIFPGHTSPEVIKGKDRIAKLGAAISNEHIKAIAKLSSRFSYYIELDDDNNIITEYDLVRGTRIA